MGLFGWAARALKPQSRAASTSSIDPDQLRKPQPAQMTHVEPTRLTKLQMNERVPLNSRWKHLKTNNIYVVVGYCQLEATWEPGILYLPIGAAGTSIPIARAAREFMDGRLIPWSPQ